MLLKPGSVVETSLQTVLDFYQKFIVPNATRRNKTLSLSLAVSLYLIYYVREHVLKPPKNLRHIPYVGYFDLIKSVFNKQSFADMEYKFTIPLINAEGSNQSVFLVTNKFSCTKKLYSSLVIETRKIRLGSTYQ